MTSFLSGFKQTNKSLVLKWTLKHCSLLFSPSSDLLLDSLVLNYYWCFRTGYAVYIYIYAVCPAGPEVSFLPFLIRSLSRGELTLLSNKAARRCRLRGHKERTRGSLKIIQLKLLATSGAEFFTPHGSTFWRLSLIPFLTINVTWSICNTDTWTPERC